MAYLDKRIVIPENRRRRFPFMIDDTGDVAPAIKFYQTVKINLDEYIICDSDEDAAAKGVSLDETYEVSVENIYFLPPGTLKKRKI